MNNGDGHKSPADANIAGFIAFRVFFNARFYYPVIAVMFVDYGLSLEQYAMLNVAWAASIVCLEVPSGALADLLGRKRLVVVAVALMIVEMTVLCLAPVGRSSMLFVIFLFNRFLSGSAEAFASGADEALAYDSLVEEGRAPEWPAVLHRLMGWQSAAFVVAMLVGAAVYDARLLQSASNYLHLGLTLDPRTTLRFPAILTLGMAVLALASALRLRETRKSTLGTTSLRETWSTTWDAGRWILHTPAALMLIIVGICYDSIIRLFLTIGSSYYRLIQLPEYTYGLIGAGFACLGFVVPSLARILVARHGASFNFTLIAALVWIGLAGIAQIVPLYGICIVLPLGIGMYLLNFFLSHYLNAIVDSNHRATALSFRGLAMNLAYGAIGLFFAGLLRGLTLAGKIGGAAVPADAVFAKALGWLPWYFLLTVLAVWIFRRCQHRKNRGAVDSWIKLGS